MDAWIRDEPEIPEYSMPHYWDRRVRDNLGDPQAMLFRDPRFDAYERLVGEYLSAVIRPNWKVLDVACGFGRFARIVCGKQAKWHGVDFCDEMRKLWVEQGSVGNVYLNGNVRNHDVLQIVSRFGPFDFVFQVNSGKVLQWTPDQFRDAMLPLLARPGRIACLECDCFTVFNYY